MLFRSEGFLHSARSLIQISGRTARNLDGQVIMYADKMTSAMKDAIKEIDRRRNIQLEYNREHNVSPKSIYKTREEIIDATKIAESLRPGGKDKEFKYGKGMKGDLLKFLQGEMARFAANLEFEKAAKVRDEISKLTGAPASAPVMAGKRRNYKITKRLKKR